MGVLLLCGRWGFEPIQDLLTGITQLPQRVRIGQERRGRSRHQCAQGLHDGLLEIHLFDEHLVALLGQDKTGIIGHSYLFLRFRPPRMADSPAATAMRLARALPYLRATFLNRDDLCISRMLALEILARAFFEAPLGALRSGICVLLMPQDGSRHSAAPVVAVHGAAPPGPAGGWLPRSPGGPFPLPPRP